MLGVRRPTVSEVASKLQADGLISYSRGTITITDRPRLTNVACDCYRVIKEEFDTRSLGTGPDPSLGLATALLR